MGYKVDFDALDTLYYSINNKAVEWSEALGGVHESVNNLAASDCITGAGAENIKSYLSEVHSMVIGLLGRIISAHADNCLLYKRAYQDNIDTSVHAVILEDELTDIIGDLHVYQNQTYSADCQIRSALTSISDIFYNQSYRGYSTVDDDFETTKNKVKTLDKDIHSLENSHLNSDFTNTEALLEKLTAYLNTQLSKPKSYKTEFSLEQAQKDPTLQEIALAYKALSEESDAKRTALKTAGENEQARVEILQKEYEERQQTATIINWVVTGLCIVGSIAITVATCGAASPLAVALTVGAVSAGSGVIMAGTQSITSQWVETGDLSKTDWLDVGKCSLIAGVTGFVTGFVSAGVGGVVTSKLASAAVTAPLINSSSTVTRVATHVVIGSASEVASGTVSRFAGGIISTGDVDESLKQAFDPKNILFDAALGGAMSGVQGLKKPQQSYADLMSPEDAAKYRQFLEHGSTSGFTSPELKAFDKVDEALLMKRIDYDEVLAARKSAITNSDGTISGVQGIKKPQQSFADLMSPEDAVRYKNWLKVREGEMSTDYIHAGEELGSKLKTDGYKIIKTETANAANADWYDMGFDKPPIAENTIAYTVEAGNHSYSRVFLEGYNNPMSSFIVRTDEISGLSAEEIAQKLALSKVPNRIVSVDLPPSTPLEVSIVGPQPDWGTIGGDIQFAIKDVDLNPMWFSNIEELN